MTRITVALLIVLSLPAAASAAPSVVSGPHSSKATLTPAASRMLATWNEGGIAGGTIRARLLDGRGRPLGPAYAVGSTRPGFGLTLPAAVVWNARRQEFLVAFQATGPAESGYRCGPPAGSGPYALGAGCEQNDVEIYTRVLDRRGKPRGRARRVTSTGARSAVLLTAMRPGLALDARTGHALLTFTAVIDVTKGATRILRAQRLTHRGAAVGGPVRIGPEATGSGVTGRPLPREGGGWTVVYETSGGPPLRGAVRAQRVSRSGRPTGEARDVLAEIGGQSPGLAVTTDGRSGRSLGVWQRSLPDAPSGAIVTRVLDPNGRPTGMEQAIPNSAGFDEVAAAPTRSGWALLVTVVIIGRGSEVFLVRLDRSGRLKGSGQQLTNYAPAAGTPSGTYLYRRVYEPAVALTASGRLLGAWTEELLGPGPQSAPAEVVTQALG